MISSTDRARRVVNLKLGLAGLLIWITLLLATVLAESLPASRVLRENPLRLAMPAELDQATQARISEVYSKRSFGFEANHGQAERQVKFRSRGSGYDLYLTATEAVLILRKAESAKRKAQSGRAKNPSFFIPHSSFKTTILRMKLIGANCAPQLKGLGELPGKSNYFTGNDPNKWRTNIPTYSKVKYLDVYPGVDVVYYGNQGELEYDFIVAPGADPHVIKVSFNGAQKLRIDKRGDLVLQTAIGNIRQYKPVIYQEKDGVRQEVAGRYVIKGNHQVGFQVGSYDASEPLIIDPVLSYSTYLGGSGGEQGQAIAVDPAGNAYVTGFTTSTDFPTTSPFQTTFGGGSNDAIVAKVNSEGTAVIYTTYLGGSGSDIGNSIAVDSAGKVYVTGVTISGNFPTASPFQATFSGGPNDAFVTVLNPAGSALIYSTYLGGSGQDEGFGITVDSFGSSYVTGETTSTDFPVVGPLQAASGGFDAFVTKFNPAGSPLFSTYLGGSNDDRSRSIVIDLSGNAFVTGATASNDYPTTPGAFQTTFKGGDCIGSACGDAFVTKLNSTGSAVIYSTYLSGSGVDGALSIDVDISGNAYVTGTTASFDFPTTPGAFQKDFHGGFPWRRCFRDETQC